MAGLSRRGFIEGAALASLIGASVVEARTAITSTELAPNLRVISGVGCNVVALGSPEGILLVDGGLEQHSSALLKEVSKGSRASRVNVLFNTHWHPEQTGSNQRIGKSGATLIAHENTKLWLSRPIKAKWLSKPFGPLPEKARPNKTTYTTDSLSYAGEQIDYGYMFQAHTDGDIYVYFRNANVLATGGVVSAAGWPRLDWETGGWIGGLVAGYDRLIKVANDATRVVPANGPVLTRADLQKHRQMYMTIYERVVALLNKGLGPDEAIATEPAKEFAAEWGDPKEFVDSAFRSLWGHFAPDG
jgi:glyoxylase-like metal-dependent hydrolase (beta-lactamase superfamily II)